MFPVREEAETNKMEATSKTEENAKADIPSKTLKTEVEAAKKAYKSKNVDAAEKSDAGTNNPEAEKGASPQASLITDNWDDEKGYWILQQEPIFPKKEQKAKEPERKPEPEESLFNSVYNIFRFR